MSRPPLTRRHAEVLRALDPVRYQTIDTVAQALGMERSVARLQLTQLRDRGLAEDNGEHPLAFRRATEET